MQDPMVVVSFKDGNACGLCIFRRGSIMISWRYLENDTPLKVNMQVDTPKRHVLKELYMYAFF